MTQDPQQSHLDLVIADDHRMFVQAIVHLLERDGGMNVLDVANNGDDLLKMLQSRPPDIAIVDISMPGPGAAAIGDTVRDSGLNVRLIALTMHIDKGACETLMDHGYAGYVIKDCAFEDLQRAITAVAAGDVFVSDAVRDPHGVQLQPSPLTRRETECLAYAADGVSNRAIAERLGVSVRTVKYHFENILRKLEAKSRGQAVAIAQRRKLIRSIRLD